MSHILGLHMKSSTLMVMIVVSVIAAAMIASTVVTSDVSADIKRDRANNVLDKHIAAGGAHGEAAQKIKDRLNN